MTKLDQLRELGIANRARKNAPKPLIAYAGAEKTTKGRPKIVGARPWEVAGMSRRAWYNKREKAK